jgi:regulator of nucleoside diphosphate kinase
MSAPARFLSGASSIRAASFFFYSMNTLLPIQVTKSDHEKLLALVEALSPDRGRLPAHLQRLLDELNRAEVRDSVEIDPDVITLNSRVKIREIDAEEVLEFTLVSPEKANSAEGRISVLAPLGTAMLGYRTGDIFEWPAPGGMCRARVEQVLFQPERIMRRNALR